MKLKLGMGLVAVVLGVQPLLGQAQDKPAVDTKAPATKTHVMETQAKTPAMNSQLTEKDYSMVELAPGKSVKKLTTAPAGTPVRVNPGGPVSDIVGTYDSKHNYSEKTPPAASADRHPQMVINPGTLNEKYQEKGKVMMPQAPVTKPQQPMKQQPMKQQ